MANKKYSDLVSEVLPYLSADPSDPVTEKAIQRTIIDFCAGSWVWQSLPDPISVIANINTYDLEPDTGSVVAAVLAAEVDGVPLKSRTVLWLNKEIPRWRTTTGTPKYFTQLDTETLMLAPLPQASQQNGLTLTVAYKPSQSAKDFPAWIFEQFADKLINGAIARLMLMPERPWTDLGNGMDRRNKFESDIAGARNSAVSALGTAPLRTSSQH